MRVLFIFLFYGFSSLNLFHPLHVSVMNLEQDKTDKALVVTVKFFTDDLEKIIGRKYNTSVKIGKTTENSEWSGYVQKYLNEQVVVRINNRPVPEIRDLSRITEDDAIWISYRIPVFEKIQKIEIQNTLLFDMYYDQTNLLMLTYGGRDYTKKMEMHDALMTVYFAQ
jgi:hypothetical protein